MADVVVSIPLNFIENYDSAGKVVNVYDTYAHALAHAATGLVEVKALNVLTGAAGATVAQTAKTAGPAVDSNGRLSFVYQGAEPKLWLMSTAGRFGGPLPVDIVENQTDISS